MEFIKLKASLKEHVGDAYLLYGEDIFLVTKAIELISAHGEVTRFTAESTEEEINVAMNTPSMFGDKRIVVIVHSTKDAPKPMPKYVQPVDCNPMSGDFVVKLVVKEFTDRGKQITSNAAIHLAKLCRNNYARINNEITKLLNYYDDKTMFDITEVKSMIAADEEYQTYELGACLFKRDFKQAEKILETLRASGTDDYLIFASLLSQIRRSFYSLTCGASNETVAGFLKCHPFAVTATRRDCRAFTEKITLLYKTALTLEYEIKSGKLTIAGATGILQMCFAS